MSLNSKDEYLMSEVEMLEQLYELIHDRRSFITDQDDENNSIFIKDITALRQIIKMYVGLKNWIQEHAMNNDEIFKLWCDKNILERENNKTLESNKIKCLLVEPNKLPKLIEIDNTLEAKQEQVNGLIECAYLEHDDDVVLICNEDGKINGMELNRDIGYDIIAGSFLIVGDDIEHGNFKSLTHNQIQYYKTKFGQKSIDKVNNIKDMLKQKRSVKHKDYER